jgi:putative flippase GtrA
MLSPAFRRYLVVGVSVYLFELLVIFVAQHLGAAPALAVALSFCLGTAVSFGLQKIVTFGDKRLHHKVLLPQAIAVSLLLAFNLGFTILLASLLTPPLPAAVVRTMALGVTTLWNFYLYRTHIFRSDNVGYTSSEQAHGTKIKQA